MDSRPKADQHAGDERHDRQRAGLYPILQGTLGATANYQLTFVPGALLVGSARFVPLGFRAGSQERDTYATDTRPRDNDAGLVVDTSASTTLISESGDQQPIAVCSKRRVCRPQ